MTSKWTPGPLTHLMAVLWATLCSQGQTLAQNLSLRKNKHLEIVQGQVALDQVIQDSTWCTDPEMGPLLEGFNLGLITGSAVHRDHPQT